MTPRKAGKRGTPERVVQLLQEEVKRTSQAATARATGLTLKGVQNYLKGIGEPTSATLEKLGAYFGVSVAWLRGDYKEHTYEQEVSYQSIWKTRRDSQRVWSDVASHYGTLPAHIMRAATHLEKIEQRSLLQSLENHLKLTGRGIYDGLVPDEEIMAMKTAFKESPLKIVIDDLPLNNDSSTE